MQDGLIHNKGNANVTVHNITTESFTNRLNLNSPIIYRPTSGCSFQDEVLQIFEVDGMVTDAKHDLGNIKRVGFMAVTPRVSTRTQKFIYKNAIFRNIENHDAFSVITFGFCSICEGIFQNITFIDSNSLKQ